MHSGNQLRSHGRRFLTPRGILAGSVVAASLALSSSAAAKGFMPGDLSICNARLCVAIRSQSVLHELAAFYYDTAKPPARTRAPRLRTPFLRLEFSNGYITGIVAGTGRSKFLSYGVNLDQFRAGVWYEVPARAAAGLRALTVALRPLRLTHAALSGTTSFAIRASRAAGPRPPTPRHIRSTRDGGGTWFPVGVIALATLMAFVLLTQRHRQRTAARPIPKLR